jgi:hypothetical protein
MRVWRFRFLFALLTTTVGHGALAEPLAVCEPPDSEPTLRRKEPASTLNDILANFDGFKSDQSVDTYLQCPRISDPPFLAKQKKYRSSVKAASNVSGVPYAILACVFFQESGWDEHSTSKLIPTHPEYQSFGIAQLLDGTFNTTRREITHSSRFQAGDLLADLRRLIPNDGSNLNSAFSDLEMFFRSHAKHGAISSSDDLLGMEGRLANLMDSGGTRIRRKITEYLSDADAAIDHAEAKRIYTATIAQIGHPPQSMSHYDPDASIIIGAIYLKEIYRGLYGPDDGDATADRWIITAGQYNIGPGKSKCDEEMSADDCIKLTKNHITREYMKSIRTCSEKGNRQPMRDRKGGACPI